MDKNYRLQLSTGLLSQQNIMFFKVTHLQVHKQGDMQCYSYEIYSPVCNLAEQAKQENSSVDDMQCLQIYMLFT